MLLSLLRVALGGAAYAAVYMAVEGRVPKWAAWLLGAVAGAVVITGLYRLMVAWGWSS